MDKKEVKKLIKAEFKDIINANNFIKKTDTLYVKVTDRNVLHIINFDLGSIGFTCSVAMQPLYIFDYSKGIYLDMGERLSRFKIVQKEWWSYEQPQAGIKEIKELLLRNGMPWFKNYGTPEGIIDFISTGKYKEYGFIAFDSFHRKRILGFSLLYSGRIDEGVKCINDLMSEIKDNAADFMLSYKKQLAEFVERIKNQPETLPGILEGAIIDNKASLKI